ncbi:glycosyltransferase [Candidatus Woesearchaeota archaeon]|nr:glycosyltransferase [Candidatus Woesearchaeota archaeon]
MLILHNKKLSLIVPVYKGEKFIAENLKQMKQSISKYFPNFEIIAVIDGYVDKSMEEAKKVAEVKVLGYKDNCGKGHALKYGFQHCTGDFVTFVDSDMDLPPRQLKNFIPYMATADMIIGSKRHPFSKLEYPLSRKILSKGYQLFSWMLLGVGLRDTQSGLKLMKKEVLDVIMPLAMVKRHAFDLELCFLAEKHGFRCVEAPIHIDYKFSGTSISRNTIFKMFLDTLAIRYRYSILHHYQKEYHNKRFGSKK